MAIVYFHPQSLTPTEVAVHKAELVDYFTQGPGLVCQLDSLYFQESSMTRCTHEQSPYQLLYGQPHIYEEVTSQRFNNPLSSCTDTVQVLALMNNFMYILIQIHCQNRKQK